MEEKGVWPNDLRSQLQAQHRSIKATSEANLSAGIIVTTVTGTDDVICRGFQPTPAMTQLCTPSKKSRQAASRTACRIRYEVRRANWRTLALYRLAKQR